MTFVTIWCFRFLFQKPLRPRDELWKTIKQNNYGIFWRSLDKWGKYTCWMLLIIPCTFQKKRPWQLVSKLQALTLEPVSYCVMSFLPQLMLYTTNTSPPNNPKHQNRQQNQGISKSSSHPVILCGRCLDAFLNMEDCKHIHIPRGAGYNTLSGGSLLLCIPPNNQ